MERHGNLHYGSPHPPAICDNREIETLETSLEEAALLLEVGSSPFSTDFHKSLMEN